MPKTLIENIVIEEVTSPPYTSGKDTYEIVVSIRPRLWEVENTFSIGSWDYNMEMTLAALPEEEEHESDIPVHIWHTAEELSKEAGNRGIWLVLKSFGLDQNLIYDMAPLRESDENQSGLGTDYSSTNPIARKDFEYLLISEFGGAFSVDSMWISGRPGDSDPFRSVVSVTISKEKLIELQEKYGDPTVVIGEPATTDEAQAGEIPIDRALPQFRQTFRNIIEFEDLISRTVSGLKKYDKKLSKSYFKYNRPPPGTDLDRSYSSDEIDKWPKLSFKRDASQLRAAGDKIVSFLRSKGHATAAPFEIGFQEYYQRAGEGMPVTKKLKQDVERGIIPGIIYVGRLGEGGSVNIYTPYGLKNQAGGHSEYGIDEGINIPWKHTKDTLSLKWPSVQTTAADEGSTTISFNPPMPGHVWGGPGTQDTKLPFTKSPLANNGTRWYLAKLREIGYKAMGGKPSPEELKMQAKATAALAATEALADPCNMTAPGISQKEPMPVDEFIERYVFPQPEKSFDKGSLMDLAKSLAGWHSSDDASQHRQISRSLTTESALQFLINESSTSLSDYIGDMVWKNMPRAPNKIRSVHDAYAYILGGIDIPTLVIKLLECLGLTMSLEDLIDMICDEIIKIVGAEYGVEAIVKFIMEDGFEIPGDYIDVSHQELMDPLQKAAADQVDTGSGGADQLLTGIIESPNPKKIKRLICLVIALGPFAAVAALIWLLNHLLFAEATKDEIPAKKKCDIKFSLPDDWPIWDAIWDFIVRMAKKKLEEEAMRLLEEKVIQPLRELIWQILDFCDEDDANKFGVGLQLEALVGFEEAARPLFLGQNANDFLRRLLASLTPGELCMLVRGTEPIEAPRMQKVLKFIMEFSADPENNAPPFTVIAEQGGPGTLGSDENIIQFFRSLDGKIDTSICDRPALPDEPISKLCDDIGSNYEQTLRDTLQQRGLSEEKINEQVNLKKQSNKEALGSAVKHLLESSNASERVQQDTKKVVQNILIEAMEASNSGAVKAVIESAGGSMQADVGKFAFALLDAPFLKRIVAGIDSMKGETLFRRTSVSGVASYHNYRFNIFDAKYLEQKAVAMERGGGATSECDEIKRHIKLMEDLQSYMVQDLFDAQYKYWDGEVFYELQEDGIFNYGTDEVEKRAGDDAANAAAEAAGYIGSGKSGSAYRIYNKFGTSARKKRQIIEASWFNLPHKRLIERYNNLTPQEFDDLAVIAFRFYSRYILDFDIAGEEPQEKDLRLKGGGKYFSSFYYNPLTFEGGPTGWLPKVFDYNFRMGGSRPWRFTEPGPDTRYGDAANPTPNLSVLLAKLNEAFDWTNEGHYYLHVMPADKFWITVNIIDDTEETTEPVYTTTEEEAAAAEEPAHVNPGLNVRHPRTDWVPKDTRWSVNDLKTALVQLLVFVWDSGKDDQHDFPYYQGAGKIANTMWGTEKAWGKNLHGGHLLRALSFYKWGYYDLYGFESSKTESEEINLVEAEREPDAEDTVGYWNGWIPKPAYLDPETLEPVLPNTMRVNKEQWEEGHGGNSLTPFIATSDEQLLIVNPETGIRSAWIPAPEPTPKNIFCNPDLEPPKPPTPEPVYEATYMILPPIKDSQGDPMDLESQCVTDDYSITVVKPGDPNGDLLNYRSTELLKLWDDMGSFSPDGETPGYYLGKTKEVLEKNWEVPGGFGWGGFRVSEPIAPQIFERMVIRQIAGQGDIAGKLPSFNSPEMIDEDYAYGLPAGKSLSHSLKDILSERKQGRKHLYGTAFRSILRDLSELSLKYGIADKARGNFDTVHDKVIAGIAAALGDINTGVATLIDLNDISKDAANKHKASMADSDLSDLSTVPTMGKTLISYPPEPIIKRVKHEGEPDEIIVEEVDWSKGPALIRLLVRLGIMERVFKSIITSAAYDTELSFGSGPMKALLSKLIGDSVGNELKDKIKIVASDLSTIGDDPSIYEAIMPLIEHESKSAADKIAGVLAQSGEARIPDLAEFLRDKVYDLARCHPDSNLYSTNDDLAQYFPLKYEAAHPETADEVTWVDPETGETKTIVHASHRNWEGEEGTIIRMEFAGKHKDITIAAARQQLEDDRQQIQEVKLSMDEIVQETSGQPAADMAKYHLTNNLHVLPRFFNDRGQQETSGFILEKYIKIKFKNGLKEIITDTNLSKQFFDAWANYLPIEHRGNPVDGWMNDGPKFPAYLNPEEFTEAIGNFFTYFGNMNPTKKSTSVFNWSQLFDPDLFNAKLQELSDKVYNDGKQCKGDKKGYDSRLDITRDLRDVVSNGASAAIFADFETNDVDYEEDVAAYTYALANPKKMVISRSAEIQRHIALMERLLEPQLKHFSMQGGGAEGSAIYEGYVAGGVGDAANDSGRPFNAPPGLGYDDPVTEYSPDGIYRMDRTEVNAGYHDQSDNAKNHPERYVMNDFDDLTNQEKRDLETIAFRFYSRYHFGDLRAFYFDPHDVDSDGNSKFPSQARGDLHDFVKRKGHLDVTMDYRTGLRRPGAMWKHAIDQTEGGKTMKGIYPVPQPNDANLNLHIPMTLIDLIKMVDMQLRWRDYDNAMWDDDESCADTVNSFVCKDPAYITYKTNYIQKSADTKHASFKLPNLASESITYNEEIWDLEAAGELDSGGKGGAGDYTSNRVGRERSKTSHWKSPFKTSAGLKYKDPSDTQILRSMAKLLCYPYELGDFQRQSSDFSTVYDRYRIPSSQRWEKSDTKHNQDIKFANGGLHTNSTLGEKWTALFGGHLYWALQYYKKGLWESTVDFVSSDTGVSIGGAPSPLGIFTMDSSENSTLIKLPGATPPDMESLKDKPLTGPNGFADVAYGLRLSYVVPPDKSSSSWRRYPLSGIRNGLRQDRGSFWGTIDDTLKAMWQPGPMAANSPEAHVVRTFNFQTNLKIHAVDTFDAMKREKSFFMKEVGEFIPEVTGPEGVGHKVVVLPILEHEVPAGDGLMWNDIQYGDQFEVLFSAMKQKDDFKLLFDYVVPLKRAVAILSIRDMLNFEQSLEITPYDKSLFGISQKSVIDLIKWAFNESKDDRVSDLTELERIQEELLKSGASEADLKNFTDQLSALTVPEPSE